MTWTRAAAVCWTLLILLLTTLPGQELPRVGVSGADKLAHFVLFAGFGWLWMRDGRHAARVKWVLIAGLALALLTEAYQGIVPIGRSAELWDVFANASGLLAGIGVHWLTKPSCGAESAAMDASREPRTRSGGKDSPP
jgi:VanZ family protein